MQKNPDPEKRKIRRPDPRRVRFGKPDDSITSVSGLVPLGTYIASIGVDAEFKQHFDGLKTGDSVVYPMDVQLRTVLDSTFAGEPRIFGLESMASDPLFVHLAGGAVASIDTHYRDLARFGTESLIRLEAMVARHGLSKSLTKGYDVLHIDIDTTVEPLFGSQEGALPGYNPRYHGRPSYHPIIARFAETRTFIGAQLRPGDTGFGSDDVPTVMYFIARAKTMLNRGQVVRVRIDSAGDCTSVMAAIIADGDQVITRPKLTGDLLDAVFHHKTWETVELDENERPLRQVADIPFARKEWIKAGIALRVIAVRTRDEMSGKQLQLWRHLDYTVKVYITSDFLTPADDIAHEYEDRAGIEPMIGELKHGWSIGAVPSADFNANHAMFLLKLLAANLVRRFVMAVVPSLHEWRIEWLRRAVIRVPGRLLHHSRGHVLRVSP
ncbi:MAG TPA: IS1380 family transposase, partial [Candidatus Paceibacterota bacterium]|nr:IS1380 family transposase [Candidatus Paceibacterota bacterium]